MCASSSSSSVLVVLPERGFQSNRRSCTCFFEMLYDVIVSICAPLLNCVRVLGSIAGAGDSRSAHRVAMCAVFAIVCISAVISAVFMISRQYVGMVCFPLHFALPTRCSSSCSHCSWLFPPDNGSCLGSCDQSFGPFRDTSAACISLWWLLQLVFGRSSVSGPYSLLTYAASRPSVRRPCHCCVPTAWGCQRFCECCMYVCCSVGVHE